MNTLYRYELECQERHVWISSPTEEEHHTFTSCPICGCDLTGFERYRVVEKFNFALEPAERISFKDKVIGEKKFYVAIQDQHGRFVARNARTHTWDDAISVISQMKDIDSKMLLNLLKKKGWSVY